MTNQQIFEGMTKGEWEVSALDSDNIMDDNENFIGEFNGDVTKIHMDNANANAFAATTAVNNTYVKGLDPAKYDIAIKLLESVFQQSIEQGRVTLFLENEICDLLTSCKLK